MATREKESLGEKLDRAVDSFKDWQARNRREPGLDHSGSGDSSDDHQAADFHKEMKDAFKDYRESKSTLQYPTHQQLDYLNATVESFNKMDYDTDQSRKEHALEHAKKEFKSSYDYLDKVEHNGSLSYPEDVVKAMNRANIKPQDTWRGEDGTIYFNFKNERQLNDFNKAYKGDDKATWLTDAEDLKHARAQRNTDDEWVTDRKAKLDDFADQYAETLAHSANDQKQAATQMHEILLEAEEYMKPGSKAVEQNNHIAAFTPDYQEPEPTAEQNGFIASFHDSSYETQEEKFAKYSQRIEEFTEDASEAAVNAFHNRFPDTDHLPETDQDAMDKIRESLEHAARQSIETRLHQDAEHFSHKSAGDEEWSKNYIDLKNATTAQAEAIADAIEHGADHSRVNFHADDGATIEPAQLQWTDQPITDPADLRDIADYLAEVAENPMRYQRDHQNHLQYQVAADLGEQLAEHLNQGNHHEASTTARALQYILPNEDRDGLPQSTAEEAEKQPAAV